MRWSVLPAMLVFDVLAPRVFSEAQQSDKTLAASGRVSTTAEAVCVLRAIAAKHPDPKIRNPDYLAEKFVSPEVWRTSPFRDDPDRARHNPNSFWVNARTHHMDALLVDALSAGVTHLRREVDRRLPRVGGRAAADRLEPTPGGRHRNSRGVGGRLRCRRAG